MNVKGKIVGRQIAQIIFTDLSQRVNKLRKKSVVPHLAILLVGDDPASKAYVRQKVLKAAALGVKTVVVNYEVGIKNYELLKTIEQLNNDKNIYGIIVQRPLPNHIDEEAVNNAVSPEKDVDSFHPNSRFEPPIVNAVLRILEAVFQRLHLNQGVTLTSWLKIKKIIILGKGETGGGPIIKRLKELGLKFKVIDSKTPQPELITRNADIIISAVGKPNTIRAQAIKKGVILIGVGLYKGADGKLYGDYDEDKIKNKAAFYTPTPGGVGPVNVACLLENLVKSAER